LQLVHRFDVFSGWLFASLATGVGIITATAIGVLGLDLAQLLISGIDLIVRFLTTFVRGSDLAIFARMPITRCQLARSGK